MKQVSFKCKDCAMLASIEKNNERGESGFNSTGVKHVAMDGNAVIKVYHDVCNKLAELVNSQLFDGCRKWYWIGDEVGGVCDFEDSDVLNPEDMVRIIENGMSYDEYAEWNDANLDNDSYINLKSWLMGARHNMLNDK